MQPLDQNTNSGFSTVIQAKNPDRYRDRQDDSLGGWLVGETLM